MERCELCRLTAAIYCESDKASLCWVCDSRVHSANFLVARHSRYLLCGVCRSPTQWSSTGAVLSPTMAVCEKCVRGKRGAAGAEVGERKEVVEENQIAPPSESTSHSGQAVFSRKRRLELENVSCFASEDDDQYRSSYKLTVRTPTPASAECVRPEESYLVKEASPPQKLQRTTPFKMGEIGIPESGILESLRRFHREEMGAGLQLAECCSLSEDGPSAVDLSSCDSS
ncbi:zinc finger protein CONSTANS-LIKE 4-like [Dorcoceras hygrometricum]|nr:zinc finger protein CONSTANS-LIKE 4-like [Dorcoceras hygrometricum]